MAVEDRKTQMAQERAQAEEVKRAHNETAKSYQQAQEKINELRKEGAGFAERELNIEKELEKIQKSTLGAVTEKFDLEII